MFLQILIVSVFLSLDAWCQEDIWSQNQTLPGDSKCFEHSTHKVCLSSENRENILNYSSTDQLKAQYSGSRYIHDYPVSTSRLKIPVDMLDTFFNSSTDSPIRNFIFKVAKKLTQFKSFEDLFNYIGLNEPPANEDEHGPNLIVETEGQRRYNKMGVTLIENNGHESISFSCATCHSANLFGTKIIGLTNRFPKANQIFIDAKKAFAITTPTIIHHLLGGISAEDKAQLAIVKKALPFVGLKKPQALGLDTSLAQVGLSLAKRAKDGDATMIPTRFQRRNKLDHVPADSKPSVWWNLKYKTRWLSDGSIISGNPVHTNFLWNELGRGADLKELDQWFKVNKQIVDDLTSYVFATKPPRYNDFFQGQIDISKAKRGEQLFLKSCKGCHGVYEKGWSQEDAHLNTFEEKISTTKTWYHTKTPVIDVGTDSYRREGIEYFYQDLNRLNISKSINTVVQPQKGYVPPPLVGIWSRWPYFHNNSAPTLYDVLTPDYKRAKSYIAVPSDDKHIDFDSVKNGYPAPHLIRDEFQKDKEYHFNTRKKGLSNKGHTKMMLNEDGSDKFDHTQKLDLIEFLKTL